VRGAELVADGRNSVIKAQIEPKIDAEIVIGADGLRSIVSRQLGLSRVARWPRRLALVTHYENVGGIADIAEMHVERDGFVGIGDVGHGLTPVALVVPASRAREFAGAAAVRDALDASDDRARRRALATYDVARKHAFAGKWLVERFIAGVVATPWLINRAADALSLRRDLADLLIGVTGDFVPAKEIVN